MSPALHIPKLSFVLSLSGAKSITTSTAKNSLVLVSTKAKHAKLLRPAVNLTKSRNSVPMREVSPCRRKICMNWLATDSTGCFFNTPTEVKVTAPTFEKQPLRDMTYHNWRHTDSFGLMPGAAGYMEGGISAKKADSKGGEHQAMGIRNGLLAEKAAKKDGVAGVKGAKDSERMKGGKGGDGDEDVTDSNNSQKSEVSEEMMNCAVGCPGCKMLAHKLQSRLQLQETLVSKVENVDNEKAAGLPSTDDDEAPDAVWGRGSYPHTRLF